MEWQSLQVQRDKVVLGAQGDRLVGPRGKWGRLHFIPAPGEAGMPHGEEHGPGASSASDSPVASDEVQGHLICKTQLSTALPPL